MPAIKQTKIAAEDGLMEEPRKSWCLCSYVLMWLLLFSWWQNGTGEVKKWGDCDQQQWWEVDKPGPGVCLVWSFYDGNLLISLGDMNLKYVNGTSIIVCEADLYILMLLVCQLVSFTSAKNKITY